MSVGLSTWTANYLVRLSEWTVNCPVQQSAWPVNYPVDLVKESIVFVDQNRMTGNRRQEGDWNIEESIGKIQIINVHIN